MYEKQNHWFRKFIAIFNHIYNYCKRTPNKHNIFHEIFDPFHYPQFYNNLKSTLVANQPWAPAHRTEGMSERYMIGGRGGAKRWQKVSRNRAKFWLALIVSANWLQANWLISETESRRKLISDNRRTTISSPALFRYTTEWMERDCLLLASGRRATAAVCLPKLSSPCFRVCVS